MISRLEIVPQGLEEFKDSKIFNKKEMEKMVGEKTEIKTIGKVELDEDEMSVLQLDPKFAVLRKLAIIEMEQDVQMSAAKIRY